MNRGMEEGKKGILLSCRAEEWRKREAQGWTAVRVGPRNPSTEPFILKAIRTRRLLRCSHYTLNKAVKPSQDVNQHRFSIMNRIRGNVELSGKK